MYKKREKHRLQILVMAWAAVFSNNHINANEKSDLPVHDWQIHDLRPRPQLLANHQVYGQPIVVCNVHVSLRCN